MSRTDIRGLLRIAAAAFALRAGAAVLTEYKPIFPAYYYTDAAFADHEARETLWASARGERREIFYSESQRTHIFFTTLLYRAAGVRPLAPKLANALAASLGVLAFGLFAGRAFGARAGTASALLLALWPSHIFFTSQNFKEGLSCGALMGAFLLLAPRVDSGRRPALAAAAGFVLLVALGFLRAPVALMAAAALAVAGAAALYTGFGGRRRAMLALLACLAAPIAYKGAARALLSAPTASASTPTASGRTTAPLLSPRGITDYRRARQYSDSLYAFGLSGREIGTFLFPEARFESWLDVLVFIPKSAFHVLFMPLPGLYPLDGKPGRLLAAVENVGLLTLVLLALARAARAGLEPTRLGPLFFFAAMTAGSALVELDLGGASRHKLMYLPLLFPLAAEGILRLRRAEPA